MGRQPGSDEGPPPPVAADATLWPIGPPPPAATPQPPAPTPRPPGPPGTGARGRRAARRPRRGLLVGAVAAGVAVAVGLGVTAVFLRTRPEPGVWVAAADDALVGRVDLRSGEVGATVDVGASDVEVVAQDDEAVLVYDTGASRLLVVDPSTGTVAAPAVRVPVGSRVEAGGGVVAILDTVDGELWRTTAERLGDLDVATAPTSLTGLSNGSRLAVGPDGVTYVVDPERAALLVVQADGAIDDADGIPLRHVAPGDDLLVTAVGPAPVVLDRTSGRLYLPGFVVGLHTSPETRLQRPGPDADAVVVATSSVLVSQPVDGRPATVVRAGGENPPAPVLVAGCGYAAWHGTGAVVRDCPGTEDDLVGHVDVGADAELRFRVDGDEVLLNDQRSGASWLAADDLAPIGSWPAGPEG